jgi:Fibronectin type III domain
MRGISRSSRLSGLATVVCLGAAIGLAMANGAFAAGGPTASTQAAKEITDTTALVSGSVNPGGQVTTYAFQYGTSTQYTEQTGVQSLGPVTSSEQVSARLAGLRPGTTYHVRLLASNQNGAAAGQDVTFRTAGLAPPGGTAASVTTGGARYVHNHEAILNGTITSPSENVHYYFQLGTRQPYQMQTADRTLPASGTATAVQASIEGLQSGQVFHYRLVAVDEDGEASAGADQSFATEPVQRVNPRAVTVSIAQSAPGRLPDTVTVSGRLVPPAGLNAGACQGFVDIAFRAHTIAIQMQRAGLHGDCTFSLPVRFSSRRRLLGGVLAVDVLFPGNQLLHRLAAPPQTIRVG